VRGLQKATTVIRSVPDMVSRFAALLRALSRPRWQPFFGRILCWEFAHAFTHCCRTSHVSCMQAYARSFAASVTPSEKK